MELKSELNVANAKTEYLEGRNRLDNLIIAGLPINNYAEAALSTRNQDNLESSAVTESPVLELVNNKLVVLCHQVTYHLLTA